MTIKKSYSVLVECLENILKHTSMLKERDGKKTKNVDGIVILGHDEDNYFIMIGNLVENESVSSLEERIKKVNSLDRDGLKLLHTEVLTNGTISERGGAGLGLIEIAMKSRNKIDFEFSKYNTELSFFAMRVKLSLNN